MNQLEQAQGTYKHVLTKISVGVMSGMMMLCLTTGCGQKGALYLPKEPVKQSDSK